MRNYYTLLLCLFPIFSIAQDCKCIASFNENQIINKELPSEGRCLAEVENYIFAQYKQGNICKTLPHNFSAEYSCQFQGSAKRLLSEDFSCKKFDSIYDASEVAGAVAQAKILGYLELLDPTRLVRNTKCIDGVKIHLNPVYHYNKGIKADNIVRLSIKDKAELKHTLKKIINSKKLEMPGDVLDRVDNINFKFLLKNDVAQLEKGGVSGDDLGFTHQLIVAVTKKLKGTGYHLFLAYETNLYTTPTTPGDENREYSADGNYSVNQYFIEENIAKVILEKEKEGDAVYWKAGGAIHEINKSNTKGTLGSLSALGNQTAVHDAQNNNKAGTSKNLNNISQDGSDLGAMIEAVIGKRTSLFTNQNTRIFVKTEASTRLTSIQNASNVGADVGVYIDKAFQNGTVIRAGIGKSAKVYIDSSTQDNNYFEIIVGGEEYEGTFRYNLGSGTIAGYQNPLPSNVTNREEHIPIEEGMIEIYIKKKWGQD